MSAIRRPLALKTSTFSVKDKSEKHFRNISAARDNPHDTTKLENFFETNKHAERAVNTTTKKSDPLS